METNKQKFLCGGKGGRGLLQACVHTFAAVFSRSPSASSTGFKRVFLSSPVKSFIVSNFDTCKYISSMAAAKAEDISSAVNFCRVGTWMKADRDLSSFRDK